MDRMSPLDASFLYLEDAHSHMHIGSVSIFEGPPPTYDEIVSLVEAKLPLLPRYRQKVRFVPLDVSRPVWVEDPRFNVGYHVRHTAIPPPGEEEQLRRLVGRLMSQQLDRHKPLWELWMIDGLSSGRWALVSKIHHCMVDGVSGTDVLTVLLDEEREPAHDQPPGRLAARPRARWGGAPLARGCPAGDEPGGGAARGRALAGVPARARPRDRSTSCKVSRPCARLSRARRPRRSTARSARTGAGRGRERGCRRSRRSARGSAGRSTTSCSPSSRRASARCSWRAGRTSRTASVRTLVPVSVRRPDERGTYNNRVSAMFAQLPVASPTRSPAWRRSARRCRISRSPSRRSPARRSPRCRASPRRCCSRWARACSPTRLSATSTR